MSSQQDCLRNTMSKAGRENFPVASRLLPRRYRRDLLAIYGFARSVDDIGDDTPPRERLALLEAVDTDLVRLYAGRSPRSWAVEGLTRTIREHAIPAEPFHLLVEANRRDQTVTRYETFDDLLGYCALSANPVGRLVLHVFGAVTESRLASSDRVCSALQIIEHCQDVGEDLGRGRIYLPGEDLRRFGCPEDHLAAPVTSPQLRDVLAFQVSRAERMLAEGSGLIASLAGFARLAVAGYVAGGHATVTALKHARHDVLGQAVRPRRARLLTAWARILMTKE
ncbi:phytoene synthase [Microtetraspora sp. NBRC 13810]|uniref:squalene synthase HpnC n=1 Tax=Microtetraspora sp. NBRC 13810 TaxID=3030990 RepID=UPI0024A55D1A|nr:squalene synthase HpnC [Microtetraspora sp. NBRC 13810]GLW07844.1 phytoene synthase [Microtetraspora sp. NBRC 13810]